MVLTKQTIKNGALEQHLKIAFLRHQLHPVCMYIYIYVCVCICIYIYICTDVVKLLSGPSAILDVIIWAKWELLSGQVHLLAIPCTLFGIAPWCCSQFFSPQVLKFKGCLARCRYGVENRMKPEGAMTAMLRHRHFCWFFSWFAGAIVQSSNPWERVSEQRCNNKLIKGDRNNLFRSVTPGLSTFISCHWCWSWTRLKWWLRFAGGCTSFQHTVLTQACLLPCQAFRLVNPLCKRNPEEKLPLQTVCLRSFQDTPNQYLILRDPHWKAGCLRRADILLHKMSHI